MFGKRLVLFCLLGCLTLVLSSCSGGGDSSDTTTHTSITSQETYTGAVGVGDFLRLTFNWDNSDKTSGALNYEIEGTIFDNQTGSLNMKRIEGKSHFYELTGTNLKAYMFLAENMAFFSVPLNGKYVPLVGLKEVKTQLTDEDFIGTYNYIFISKTGDLSLWQLQIQNDGTFYAEKLDNSSNNATGCWKLSEDGIYILAAQSTADCTNITSDNATYRIVVKPGNKRKAIVVDYVDGSGFGLGLEQFDVAAVVGNYTRCSTEYYWWGGPDEEGWGNSKIDLSNNSTSFEEYYFDNTPADQGNTTLIFNCNNNTGIVCTTNNSANSTIFLDPEEGYFMEVYNENGTIYYTIGSVTCE